MDLAGQLEKMAHDITSGPALSDSISIAVMGGALGGLVGYLKEKNARGAKSFALWGAGLGIAGQYMIFHMLKPALRTFGRTAHASAQAAPMMQMMPRFSARGEFAVGDGTSEKYHAPEKCPDGFHWEMRSSGPGISGIMVCAPDTASHPTLPSTATGWGHGEMMGAIPYPYYYAWWE